MKVNEKVAAERTCALLTAYAVHAHDEDDEEAQEAFFEVLDELHKDKRGAVQGTVIALCATIHELVRNLTDTPAEQLVIMSGIASALHGGALLGGM